MNNRKEVFLASNLKFLRQNAHLNKGELSSLVGTSISEIGHLEENLISKPNFFILEALADYFGVDIQSLVREDLTRKNLVELRLKRALINLPVLAEEELRSCMALCDDLINLLGEKRYFDYRPRIIKPPPPRR